MAPKKTPERKTNKALDAELEKANDISFRVGVAEEQLLCRIEGKIFLLQLLTIMTDEFKCICRKSNNGSRE